MKKKKDELLAREACGRRPSALFGMSWSPKRPIVVSFDGSCGGASNEANYIRRFAVVRR
jgi:hypothetical protein